AELPKFEVASIKPTDPNARQLMGVKVYPGGRVVIASFNLKALIVAAFRVSHWQISGGDEWTDKELYTIEAKPSDSMRASIKSLRFTLFGLEDEHLRQMLQALLVDRFQLKFHRDTKTGDIYFLERSGKALRMRPTNNSAETAENSELSAFGSIGYAGGGWN